MPLDKSKAERAIRSIDKAKIPGYETYFHTLIPRCVEDRFRRWLFSFASVHTGWKANCKLYEYLKPLDWLNDNSLLRARIIESRAGMYDMRTRFISAFTDMFWRYPSWFDRMPGESWIDYRNRLMENVVGLGKAKAAFVVELNYFHQAKVICSDTHFYQLYGFTPKEYGAGKIAKTVADDIEVHWIDTCEDCSISPVTARWILWDEKNDALNPRYWSWVLE